MAYARKNDMTFFETSAKTSTNVLDVFKSIATTLQEKRAKEEEEFSVDTSPDEMYGQGANSDRRKKNKSKKKDAFAKTKLKTMKMVKNL